MARCGCSSTCSCSVVAGDGVTVSGVGTAGNPYVISTDASGALTVLDTPTINLTLLGSGTEADPHILSAAVSISAIAGNLVAAQADGLAVTCESIQDCVGSALGDGLQYNDALNRFNVFPSADAGNAVSIGGDGGVFVPTGGGNPVATANTNCITLAGNGVAPPLSASPVINAAAGNLLACTATGLRAALTMGACGLEGTGAPASPLQANVGAWPWACADTAGRDIYCRASDGQLIGDPPILVAYDQVLLTTVIPNTAVPASAVGTTIQNSTVNVPNPSTCRNGAVISEVEVDVDFNIPAGGAAVMQLNNDAMYRVQNTGGTAMTQVHVQASKTFSGGTIGPAPAASANSVDAQVSNGAGGAVYNRAQTAARSWVFAI